MVTYGVQGATLDETHYHPGDESRFEEGYVALTRGRRRTRLYVVEGELVNGDLAHDGQEHVSTGLDTVAAAMEQRRARALAHETDPKAAHRVGDRRRDLRSLRLERERLDDLLSQAPSSSADVLCAARRHRDSLLSRRQLWEARLEMAHRTQGRNVSRSRRRGRAGSDPSADAAAARRELETIDRGLRAITERIEHHERREAARQAFFAEHAAEAERRDVLCRAERAREVQVRAGALARVPREVELLLAPRPSSRDACLIWESAVQEVAVYRERYDPRSPASATDPLIEILGKRPMPGPARRSYDRALAAIEAAAQPSLPKSAEPELLVT